ncbi:hypothetical protein [Streptomyces sp. NBC_00057]|uniref:hypothetical protein n=1 Tax=Streptomyces sp. NBC_00057 TaxID=2975634 RepID=UPI00324EA7B7
MTSSFFSSRIRGRFSASRQRYGRGGPPGGDETVPARGSAVLDGRVAAFRTALRSSSSIAPGARIIKGGETID